MQMRFVEILTRLRPTPVEIPVVETAGEKTERLKKECQEYLDDPTKNRVQDFQEFAKNIIILSRGTTESGSYPGDIFSKSQLIVDIKGNTPIFLSQKQRTHPDVTQTIITIIPQNQPKQKETLMVQSQEGWPSTIMLTQETETREINSYSMGKQQLSFIPGKSFDETTPETNVMLKQLAAKIFTAWQNNPNIK